MTEKYVDVPLPKKTIKKLQDKLKELKEKGIKLKDGKPVENENDVLTLMLDFYEEKHGKLL